MEEQEAKIVLHANRPYYLFNELLTRVVPNRGYSRVILLTKQGVELCMCGSQRIIPFLAELTSQYTKD